MSHLIIAIDGPAASGKSSVARLLARRLGVFYVNTGAMYRVVAWLAWRRGVNPADAEGVAALLRSGALEFGGVDGQSVLRVEGADPGDALSDPAVNASVSAVAAIPAVREYLVARQREYALENDLVMEGRDIGTVVFPETPHKFYIDASPEERARRRAAQGIHDNLAARDQKDAARAVAPLKPAPDALQIDTTHLTLEGAVETLVRELEKRGVGR